MKESRFGLVEDSYRVALNATTVGRLHRRGDHTRFMLDPEYLNDSTRPVLGLRIEQASQRELSSTMRLPWWFSNLLPEGPLRQWIAQQRRTSDLREMELLAQVGHDLPGAVSVVLDTKAAKNEAWDSVTEAQIAARLEESPWKFSLAGIAMKFSMLEREDRLTLPASGQGGDWIVKLPDAQYPHVPRNEFAMMTLASRVGIEVPPIELVQKHDLPDLPPRTWPTDESEAYAIKRFDRRGEERIHMEDLAQVRGFYPENKYSGTFESIAANVYRGRDAESLQEFVRRLVFIVLIGNGDAHLKNWSLLYVDPRIPRLSPAYDMVATAPYASMEGRFEDLGLKFDRTKLFDRISLDSFARLEQRLGAKGCDLANVAEHVVRQVIQEWPGSAEVLRDCGPLADDIGRAIDSRAAQLTR